MAQPATAAAGINKTINFQGRLLSPTGAVVADGNYNMRFKIYQDGPGNVAGNTGGTLLWTERWQNNIASGTTAPVVVKNGYFSVSLANFCAFAGGSCQGNTNTVIDFNQDTLWLSMDVAGTSTSTTPTYDGEMLPMRRLSSSVYSLQAENANKLGGLTASQFLQTVPGSTSVNTIAPTAASTVALTVKGTTGTSANVLEVFDSTATPTRQAFFDATGALNVAKSIQPTVTNTTDIGLSGTSFRTGYFGTSVVTPLIDTVSATSMTIGGTNATSISIGRSGQTITSLSNMVVSNGALSVSGTNTTSGNAKASVIGTHASSSTTSQYGFQNQVDFNPSGASLTNLYGLVNVANLSGSAVNITSFSGATNGISTAAGYTGKITTAWGTNIIAPSIAGSQLIDTYSGLQVAGNSSNTGNTTGTITNNQIRVSGTTAAAASGGTMDNYGLNLTVPSGSGAGTTNNYGVYITGGGGGTSNWSLYNNSSQNSYFAGSLLVNTTSNANSYELNVSGTIGASTGLVSPSLTATTGALTLDTNSGVNIHVGPTNATNINLGRSSANTLTTINGIALVKPTAGNDSANAFRVQNAAGNNIMTVDTSSSRLTLGTASTIAGRILFNNATNANTASILSGVTSTSYTLTLPTAVGASGDCLKDTTGAGVLGFASCGSASANLTLSNLTGPTAINTDLTFAAADRTLTVATQGTAATAGNTLTVRAATGNTTGAGGLLTLQGGTGGASGAGGAVAITGGSAGGGSTNGGAVNITGGALAGGGIMGAVNIQATVNGDTNINTGSSTGNLTVGNANSNFISNSANFKVTSGGAVTLMAGGTIDGTSSTLGIGTGATTTMTLGKTSQAIVMPGSLSLNGVTTSSNVKLGLSGSIDSSSTTLYGIFNQLDFNPTGGSINAVYGNNNNINIASSALNVTTYVSMLASLSTSAGYTGTVTTGTALHVGGPTIGGANPFTTYNGINVAANSANGGNTTGTLTNSQIKISSNTAAAAAGGIVNNYGINMNVPSGAGVGTTNNYGLFINDPGSPAAGAWSIYNSSAANSYYDGNVLINTLTNANNYELNVAGTIGATGISSATTLTVNPTTTLGLGTATTTAVTLGNTSTTTGITLNTAASGTISIGTTSQNRTIQIGTAGGGVQTVQVGSNNSTSTLLLQSGTGALNIQSQGTAGIGIGTNAVSQPITIGNSTGGLLRVGQNGGTLQLDGTNFDVATSGAVTLAGGQTADINTAVTSGTGAALAVVPGISTGASTNGATASFKGGDASGTTSVTGGTVTLQGGSATGGSGTRNGGNVVVDAGSGATANGTISIGGTNATAITIGKTSSNAATTINGTALVKPTTGNNSTTAFQVQNAGATPVFTVDTSNTLIRVAAPGTGVTLASGTGSLQVGPDNTYNLAIDDNEIMARNNGGTETLFVQRLGGGLTSRADLTVFQPIANSSTAWQVLNAAGTSTVLNADTSNSRLGVGTNAPTSTLDVTGALLNTGGNFNLNISSWDTATAAQNVGGGIGFGGNADTSRLFSAIQGYHESATAADYAGALKFLTRPSGSSSLQEQAKISSTGQTLFKNSTDSSSAFQVQTAGGTAVLGVDTSTSAIIMTSGSGNVTINQTAGNFIVNDNATQSLKVDSAGDVYLGKSDGSRFVFIGDGTASASSNNLLVLDQRGTAGDPAFVEGAMYYNANSQRFRCAEGTSGWDNCISDLDGTYAADSDKTLAINTATGLLFNMTTTGDFIVQTGGVAALTVNDSGNVLVGTSNTTGSLLVLDDKTSYTSGAQVGDPTGVVGAMYYNSALGAFRCYEVDHWRNCIQSALTAFNYTNEMISNYADGVMIFSNTGTGSGTGQTASAPGVSSHPGILDLSTGTTTSGNAQAWFNDSNDITVLLGNNDYWRYEAVLQFPVLSTSGQPYAFRGGFGDGAGTNTESTDGCYFRYTDTGSTPNFMGLCANNGSLSTACDTTTAVAINTWYRLTVVVNAAGSSADFRVNGVSKCTVSTNIPTGAGRQTSVQTSIAKAGVGTTSRDAYIDYMGVEGQFGTSR